ncbi:hypothetical protein NLG97_g3586 [Lecanicillium saksenae]|uniref:Uncharacterized protein n=1 Tax=Lecanicillium saksenae TaxID=468837 RepID=A0ACC1QXT3_9HYPO|nr:hypothetical protein NLG97_g3586 [Lecanicillium saksenae]
MATLDPFISDDSCVVVPGVCALNRAYHHHTWAKASYWALFLVLICGFATVLLPILLTQYWSGVVTLLYVYKAFVRPILVRLVFAPVSGYAVEPLLQNVVSPFFKYILAPVWCALFYPILDTGMKKLSHPADKYVSTPMTRLFPGPGTKTKHIFDPELEKFSLVASMFGLIFIAFISAVVFNISEDDVRLSMQRNSISLLAHLAVLYSIAVWLVWRCTSALNFAPAVRLEQVVYMSRIGWVAQFIFSAVSLYSCWKLYFFALVAVLREEGAVGSTMAQVKYMASFTVLGIDINVVGTVLHGLCFATLEMGMLALFMVLLAVLVISARKAAGARPLPINPLPNKEIVTKGGPKSACGGQQRV